MSDTPDAEGICVWLIKRVSICMRTRTQHTQTTTEPDTGHNNATTPTLHDCR